MPDFYDSWSISRGRFVAEYEGLTKEQLNWKIYPECLSLAEAAIHVAGIEVKFGVPLGGITDLSPEMQRVQAAATNGVVNDKPFPFTAEELTPEFVMQTLEASKALLEPSLLDPSKERREVTMVSALGPVITGEGAMARLAFHAGYHQGQVYLIRNHPSFPKA